jgi:urease alpha subunit
MMVCHRLIPLVPVDVTFAESKIRCETIAAEDDIRGMDLLLYQQSDNR